MRLAGQFFRATAYLLFLAVVAVAGLEAGLRLLEPHLARNNPFVYDRQLGFRHRPNFNGANLYGFNDGDYPIDKPAGQFRIIGVGDSFNWAQGGNNYWQAAEKLLRERGLRQIDILNQGTPATEPFYYLRLLQIDGVRFEPDMVVLGFFVGNDLLESSRLVLYTRYGLLLPLPRRPLQQALAHHSYLYSLVSHYRPLLTKWGWVKDKGVDPVEKGFPEEKFLQIERARMQVCLREFYKGPRWKETRDKLLEIKVFLASRNIPLVVILLPDEYQVNASLQEDIFRSSPGLTRKNYDFSLPQEKLSSFLYEHEIPVVDLLPAFLEASRENSLYKFRDTHFNLEGNRVTARVLAEFLEEELGESLRGDMADGSRGRSGPQSPPGLTRHSPAESGLPGNAPSMPPLSRE